MKRMTFDEYAEETMKPVKERQSWREFQFREKARRNTERLKRERQKEEKAFEKLVYDMTGLMLVLSGVMVVSYVLFFQW